MVQCDAWFHHLHLTHLRLHLHLSNPVIEHHKEPRPRQGKARPDECRILHAHPQLDGESAEISAQRIAQVECQLHHGASHQFPARRVAQQQQLLRRRDGKQAAGADAHQQDGHPRVGRKEENHQQGEEHNQLRVHGHRAGREAVGQAATQVIAHAHTSACQQHQQGHGAGTEARNLRQQRIDVAIPAENTAVAQHRGSNQQPRLRAFQEAELPL